MKQLFRSCRALRLISTASLLMLGVGQSFAELLTENVPTPLSGTTVFARPELAGTVIADRVRPFSLTLPTGGLVTGTIQDRVVRQDTAGTLDFYWRVLSDTSSAGDLAYFRIGKFIPDPYVYDANYRIDGLGEVATDSALLFGGVHSGEGYVNYHFSAPLHAGQGSLFMFLSTKATEYADVAIMDVATDGTYEASNLLTTYAPVLVPEPTALSLVVLSGLTLMALRRRDGSQS